MRSQIIEIIKTTNPRATSRIIKNNKDLKNWVEQNSLPDSNFSKRIYNSLNPNRDICEYNNIKKFKSLTHGYSFCNKVNKCLCAKESVARSVSNAILILKLESTVLILLKINYFAGTTLLALLKKN